MERRVGRSLAWRSGPVYREIVRILPEPLVTKKDPLGIPLVTMCGRAHLLLLEQLLFTIAIRWNLMPNVVVVSDGTANVSQIRQTLRWWPAGLDVVGWQTFRDFHQERERSELVQYADKDPFGRKLSTILAMAEQTRLLWCDCDILFFSDFSTLVAKPASHGPFLESAQDSFYSYDRCLTEGRLQHLYGRPPVNTGLILCEGNFYDSCGLGDIIKQGIPNRMYLTEQTILAEAVFQAGRIAWDLDVIVMFNGDESTLSPTYLGKHWIARHYVGPIRHLFWRDALAMRLRSWRALGTSESRPRRI